VKLYTINTGLFKLDGGAMFGVVPQSIWKTLNPPDANNMCTWAMRCLLVVDGNRAMLIDNGIGDKQSEKFFSYYYLHGDDTLAGSLRAAGVAPAEVTDMFLTHLHFDHCGGGVRRAGEGFELVFPQATYWTNAAHWQWATEPNAREKPSFLRENLAPMQQSGQLAEVPLPSPGGDATAGLPFWPNVELLLADGHTEKQMLPLIHYRGQKVLFCGDLVPSAGHLPTAYVMGYDVRPLQAMAEKEAILQRAASEGWLLFFEHDPIHECCSLQTTERGVRAKEFLRIADLG
jgi:glyoxylase-like metal-dependent hydrolase (beta-lactamase superfamily II)